MVGGHLEMINIQHLKNWKKKYLSKPNTVSSEQCFLTFANVKLQKKHHD